jgi:hypothetical protein
MTPVLDGLVVADDPATWTALGFAVDGDTARVGGVEIRLAGRDAGDGIVGWSVRGIDAGGPGDVADLDGLATTVLPLVPPPERAEPEHPNGATAVDHVVAFTGDFERTTGALERAGMVLRRRRDVPGSDGVQQGFFVLGSAVLELAGPIADRDRASFWGLTFVTADLDALAGRLGERLGPVRDAVQPGRRIATVRGAAGSAVPLAFMSPRA